MGAALAVPVGTNISSSRPVYVAARSLVLVVRAIPELILAVIFIAALGPDNRYRLGLKLMELGAQTQRSLNLPEEIQSRLAEIADATRDTTHLGIPEADDVLCLAKARDSRGIEMVSRPGGRLRAQNTAMGKMILFFRPRAEALKR